MSPLFLKKMDNIIENETGTCDECGQFTIPYRYKRRIYCLDHYKHKRSLELGKQVDRGYKLLKKMLSCFRD